MIIRDDGLALSDVGQRFDLLRQAFADEVYWSGQALCTGAVTKLLDLRLYKTSEGIEIYPKVIAEYPDRTGAIEMDYHKRGIRQVIEDRLSRLAEQRGWTVVRWHRKLYSEIG